MTNRAPDTSLLPFSAGYEYTEFAVERYGGSSVQMSYYREEDLKVWRQGEGADADLPVVLRLPLESGTRHVVPALNRKLGYPTLKVPDYWPVDLTGTVGALIPSAAHTRYLVGSDHGW